MEALGSVSIRGYSRSGYGGGSKNIGNPPPCSVGFPRAASRRRSASLVLGASGGEYFQERGHIDYYSGMGKKIFCGKGDCNKFAKKMGKEAKEKKKMDKKRLMKMMMEQFEGGAISPEFGDEKVAQMISGAAEALLEQLKQLKVEGKELEMGHGEDCEMMSSESSSSSESSDSESECEETVTDMLKQNTYSTAVVEPEKPLPPVVEDNIAGHEFQLLGSPVEAALVSIFRNAGQLTHSSSIMVSTVGFPKPSARKVEVCLGGKCKKSGSPALLGEFQKKLGAESGAVSGCKCMGKCKVGPNVRILDENLTSSLCIGVGLTDVDPIVANYFTTSTELALNVV